MITAEGARVHNIGPVDRIPLGEGRAVRMGAHDIAVIRSRSGEVFAVQASCPHRGGPLADGIVGGGRIVCPLHSYAFELATGEPVRNGCPALRTYRVSVSSTGEVLLSVPGAEDDDHG